MEVRPFFPISTKNSGRTFLAHTYTCPHTLSSYRPRHVIIFRSACLYHEVNEWTPTVMARNDYFTPGRVAYVYFTHSDAVEMLEGKPPGWYEKTACGNFDTGTPIIP